MTRGNGSSDLSKLNIGYTVILSWVAVLDKEDTHV